MPHSDGIIVFPIFLLLVVALCLPETRLWSFKTTLHSISAEISCFHSVAVGQKPVVWNYDVSDTAYPLVGDIAKAGAKPLVGKSALNWRSGTSGLIYPRSAGLADSTTVSYLLNTGVLPGLEGVTLAQQAVRFGDLQQLSTLGGRQVEFALTRESGMFRLYSGGPGTIATPSGVRVIGHTHPGGTRLPSMTDINSLNNAWLRQLSINPYSPVTPSRVIWGTGNIDNTIFYPFLR